MTGQHDLSRRLDDLLDALNAGKTPPAPADPELAGLYETARRIRELGRRAAAAPDVAFPSALAASLERELRSDITERSSASVLGRATDGAGGGIPPASDAGLPPPPERPRWLPEALRLVAAIAAFVVAGLVLVLVLRGSDDAGGSRMASSGSPAPAFPCLVPFGAVVQPSDDSIAYIAGGSIELARQDGAVESLAPISPGETGPAWHMAWSPDGRTLAYSSGGRIYLVEPGNDPRRLTTEVWDMAETSPTWSPDGTRIVFVVDPAPSVDPDRATETADLFVADVATGALDRLTDTPGGEGNPVWTSNNRWVMYARPDGADATDTWMVDVGNLEQHKMLAGVAITSDMASLSPDGCTVAWVDGPTGNLLIATAAILGPDAPRKDPRVLVEGGDHPVMSVSWAPDGSRILYDQITVQDATGETDFQIRTIAPDGSDSRVIASLAAAKPMSPVWSPDGGQIAFAIWDYRSGTQELRIVNSDGSGLYAVSDRLERGATFPAWRPGTTSTSSGQSVGPAPDAPLPTPDIRGIVHVQTFDEARRLASFSLLEPSVGEYGIELDALEVQTDPGSPITVTGVVAYYLYDDSMHPIEFHQHPGSCGYPDDTSGIEITSQQTVETGGKSVRETRAITPDGSPIADFRWDASGVCYFVNGVAPDDLALKRMQQIVEAVPVLPGSSEAASTAAPAPPLPPTGILDMHQSAASIRGYFVSNIWQAPTGDGSTYLQVSAGSTKRPDGSLTNDGVVAIVTLARDDDGW